MIEIGVVDLTAEARMRLVERLHHWIRVEDRDASLLPRLSLKPLSIEEIKFQPPLDLCVIGPELIAHDCGHVAGIRKTLQHISIICVLDGRSDGIGTVEQLGRMGIDDLVSAASTHPEFVRRLVLMCYRRSRNNRGKLLVFDSAKGGCGVTSITAAVAEYLAGAGKAVCLVDLDLDTQDLSRALGARPFINEPLTLLVTQQRLVTPETVRECVSSIWGAFDCLSPPNDGGDTFSVSQSAVRAWTSVQDTLAYEYDYVCVDLANAPFILKRSLFQVADEVFFITGTEIAALAATGIRMNQVSAALGPETSLSLLINRPDRGDMGPDTAVRELKRSIPILHDIVVKVLPECSKARSWVGTGTTMYGASRKIASAITRLLPETSLSTELKPETYSILLVDRCLQYLRGRLPMLRRGMNSTKNTHPDTALPALPNHGSRVQRELVTSPVFNHV